MEQNEEENNIIKEREFNLISDKNNEYKIKLYITNNDLFCIDLLTTINNKIKKYSLSLTMEELIKNRFFKIFINLEEVFRELENKIIKSNIIEESNIIYLDIPIGLNVINDIILEIKEVEKSKDEIIQELTIQLNNANNLINEKNNKINELEKQLKLYNQKINDEKNNLNNKNKKIKNDDELENINNLDLNLYPENIIELEIETKENNQNIQIINNKLFNKENTILFINKIKKILKIKIK
jgi:predicted RNase H-like nuclease (RuvC/YqgF family)